MIIRAEKSLNSVDSGNYNEILAHLYKHHSEERADRKSGELLNKAIKIIYFVAEKAKTVFVTDFFPCESDENRIKSR